LELDDYAFKLVSNSSKQKQSYLLDLHYLFNLELVDGGSLITKSVKYRSMINTITQKLPEFTKINHKTITKKQENLEFCL
jgi:hypothetical protein